MRSPYSETNPGCRQENLIVTSVMCIQRIQREEGREKCTVGGREGGREKDYYCVNCPFTVYKRHRHNH